MVQIYQRGLSKNSIILINIKSDFFKTKLIHAYKNYKRSLININQPIKFTLKIIPIIYLKILKHKTIGQIIRNKTWSKRFDNSNRKFFEIIVNPVKKKFIPKHFKCFGPSLLELANKKYFPVIKTLLICFELLL